MLGTRPPFMQVMTIKHKYTTSENKGAIFKMSICLAAIGILLMGLFLFLFMFFGETENNSAVEGTFYKKIFHANTTTKKTSDEAMRRYAEQPYSVLFISSYGYDSESVQLQMKGIEKALRYQANIRYMFMDTKNIELEPAEEALAIRLNQFTPLHEHFDAVIVGDDAALGFVIKHQNEYFDKMPIVFEGISGETLLDEVTSNEYISGVSEVFSLVETIEFAEKIYSKASKVVAIVDNSISGKNSEQQFYDCRAEFPELTFSDINCSELTESEIIEQVSALDESSILLYMMCSINKDGYRYTSPESIGMITQNAKIPAFRALESDVGDGVLGGMVISTENMGYRAGMMTGKVLEGASLSDMPIEQADRYFLFDHDVMERFELNENIFPANALYINRETTFVENYPTLSSLLLALYALLIVIAVFMAIDSGRRQKSNRKLRASQKELMHSEASLRAAIAHTGMFYWEYEIDTDIVRTGNIPAHDPDRPQIVYRYPEVLIEKGLIHPDSAETYRSIHKELKNGKKSLSCEIMTVEQDGTARWKRIRYTVLEDDEGNNHIAFGTSENIDEYKKMEQYFGMAVAQAGMVSWTYEIDNKRIITHNDASEYFALGNIVENVPESFVNSSTIHPDDVPVLTEMFQKIADGEKEVTAIIRWKNREGKWWWAKTAYTSIFNNQGKPIRAIGFAIDITAQITAEQSYEEQLSYQRMLTQGSIATAFLNLTRNTLSNLTLRYEGAEQWKVSETADEFLYRIRKKVFGGAEWDYIRNTLNADAMEREYANGNTLIELEYLFEFSDNFCIWCEHVIHLIKKPDTGDIECFMYLNDINEKRIRQEVFGMVAYKAYEMIACISTVKKTLKVLAVSAGDEQSSLMDSRDYTVAMGELIDNIVYSPDVPKCRRALELDVIQQNLETEDTYAIFYRAKGGTKEHPLRKKAELFYIDRKRGLICFMRTDITANFEEEQQQNDKLQLALAEAKKASQAKTEFLSNMSHEIRTPMNAVLGLSELALDEVDRPFVVRQYLTQINSSGTYLLGLINDILDMSRIESEKIVLKPEPITTKECVENVYTLLKEKIEEKQLQFSFESNYLTEKAIMADKMRYEQILLNLIYNAVKFTPKGGRIYVIVTQLSKDENRVKARIVVGDTGIGMTPEFVERAFNPFEQANSSNITGGMGTGLGLSIVKNLVRLMGGTIEVKSEISKGTEFTIEMEFEIAPIASDAEQTATEQALTFYNFTGRTVLLAEDNDINRQIAGIMLEKQGFTVENAVDGQEAVDMFIKHKEHYYDIILMDIKMPVMDGLEATRQIRGLSRTDAETVPIIAMTANAFDEDVELSLKAGMNAHLSKPIDRMILYRTLADCI